MPRALIAGCGYLGRALAELLTADGWDLECWTLSAESARELSEAGHRAHAIDISAEREVASRKSNFDAVIYCASTRGGDVDLYRRVYLHGAGNLIECFGGAKLLFTSSTSVYGQTNGEWVTEESATEPKHGTGKILVEAEQLILNAGGVVARLGGLYGPGRSGLLKKFLSGEANVDPEKDRFVNAIHRDDAATSIHFLLKREESSAGAFNLVDNEPILLSECYRWLAAKLDHPVLSIGRSTSRSKRGESNKRVSNAKLRALGWAPRYPNFASGMEESVLPSWPRKNA